MSYEPTIWKKGDKVTSTKLNKIENGIQGNDEEITSIKEGLTQLKNATYDDGEAVTIQTNSGETFAFNLPNGYIHVKETSEKIFTGTINNVDLIGLKQGVFTDSHSGVTIEVNGNEIYIHGTTTAGFRFNPQTGEFFTDSFVNHLADYSNLPENECGYSYSYYPKEGYTMPSNIYFAVRKYTDGSISPTALNGNVSQFRRKDSAYVQYVAIYSNAAITGINVKFTLGFKLYNIGASQGATFEAVAKSPYHTTIIDKAGYYKCDKFTWTGADNTYDVVHTTPYLQHDPLTADRVFAWFGNSLSQLKELPNIVADLLNVKVYDCSFAGAPLTYGDPTKYQPTGFMSLCNQIVAGDFTDLADALTAQQAAGIDVAEKLVHLATLQALDFNDITDVVLFAGTNDFKNDYVNATNFMSGFSGALTTLLTAYPHIIVYVVAPTWRGTNTGGVSTIPTMEDLVNLEKQVADAFSLPFYDAYHRSGINDLTASVYLQSDKLHQTDAGDKLIANKIAKFLQSN